MSRHEEDLMVKPGAGTKDCSPMTTEALEGKHCWDPYETSHRKHFVQHPKPAAEMKLRPMSTSLLDSFSLSGPFGSTVYNEDFSWMPVSKPECIRTGTASGNRRNNPHPSEAFMMWRVPRDSARSSEYVLSSWKCLSSDKDISEALKAQYCSTYTCDFLHLPQVPTVVHRHVQQRGSDLTTDDRFFGKKIPVVTSVLKSALHQELRQLHRSLPQGEKEAVKRILSGNGCSNDKEKVIKLPAVNNSCSPDWISTWPGPF